MSPNNSQSTLTQSQFKWKLIRCNHLLKSHLKPNKSMAKSTCPSYPCAAGGNIQNHKWNYVVPASQMAKCQNASLLKMHHLIHQSQHRLKSNMKTIGNTHVHIWSNFLRLKSHICKAKLVLKSQLVQQQIQLNWQRV